MSIKMNNVRIGKGVDEQWSLVLFQRAWHADDVFRRAFMISWRLPVSLLYHCAGSIRIDDLGWPTRFLLKIRRETAVNRPAVEDCCDQADDQRTTDGSPES